MGKGIVFSKEEQDKLASLGKRKAYQDIPLVVTMYAIRTQPDSLEMVEHILTDYLGMSEAEKMAAKKYCMVFLQQV